MKRRPPTADEKVACLLHLLWEARGVGVPREQQKQLEAWMTCALVEWNHVVLHTWGGSTRPTNLMPMLYTEHRKRTREIDVPKYAKVRRLARGRKPKGRPIPGSKRSIWRKRMSGKVERRP